MEAKVISTQVLTQSAPPMPVLVGSSKKFRGIPEHGDYNNKRPLMVNAWSQTTHTDFSYLNHIENREQQSQREKDLEEKIRVLEENLKAHTELLSQIHATSARTSALLGQPPQQQMLNANSVTTPNQIQTQTQQHQYLNNTHTFRHNYTTNSLSPINSNNNSNYTTVTQISPKIVNAINPIQQTTCSPAESVKYTIIAEGTGNHNDEPIEIQLAEDDGALNLNSSADSGRLEICLAPEENIEIKTEYNAVNNIVTIQQPQSQETTTTTATLTSLTTTATTSSITNTDYSTGKYGFIKKRKVGVKKMEILSPNSKYLHNNDQTMLTYGGNTPNQQNFKKRRSSGNSLLKTPNMQNISSPSNTSGGEGSHIGIDTDNVMVSIGPNNTRIPAKLYENMNWSSASIATRKLLMAIFDRKVLATHSMTGKPSPAFKDHGKPIKQMLDPLIIADIIFAVTRKCNASDKEVRNAITTKCADENKMMKLQMNKRTPMREMNKENMLTDFKGNFTLP